MKIVPIPRPLDAVVRTPGSKSLTNRALLISALANGTTRLTNALFSDDSRYFAQALQTLGFDARLDEANEEMTVRGLGGKIPSSKADLFIGNAGTAARFLSAFLTLGRGEYVVDGDPRMRERPIGDLVNSLAQLGAAITPMQSLKLGVQNFEICPPIKIIANGLRGGKTKVAGGVSSQFLSALLMVAPYAQSPIEIEVAGELSSKPYVDMTISVMKDFGVSVERSGYRSFSIPIANYQAPAGDYPIESDASAASYFFAAPAVCGGTVKVKHISRSSVQGDIAFLDVLRRMGCGVAEFENCISVTGRPPLAGVEADMRDIPDTAQTLAAIAPFASSPTVIRGIASARMKETDRIHATCAELARLGVEVEEYPDGMKIYPASELRPAEIQTYNDHRMAMAFSLIGLRFDGVTIQNPSCVSKTFPKFFEVLNQLQAAK